MTATYLRSCGTRLASARARCTGSSGRSSSHRTTWRDSRGTGETPARDARRRPTGQAARPLPRTPSRPQLEPWRALGAAIFRVSSRSIRARSLSISPRSSTTSSRMAGSTTGSVSWPAAVVAAPRRAIDSQSFGHAPRMAGERSNCHASQRQRRAPDRDERRGLRATHLDAPCPSTRCASTRGYALMLPCPHAPAETGPAGTSTGRLPQHGSYRTKGGTGPYRIEPDDTHAGCGVPRARY